MPRTDEPEVRVQHLNEPGYEGIAFTTIFNIHAVRTMGLEVINATAERIAHEFLTDPELMKFIDRDKIQTAITDAIGRAFVEKLMGPPPTPGKEAPIAEPAKPSR